MTGLKTTNDPAVFSFLFTEDLYAIKEAASGDGNRAEAVVTPEVAAVPETPGIPETLVPSKAAPPETSGDVFHYLGENRRFVLVLVNYPDEKYLPEAEKAYLLKVLSAVKLGLDDIALLNYAHYPGRKYAELKDFFAFNYLLLFGVAATQLQIPGPILPYHLGLVEGVKILAADSTEAFRPDNTKKKALWGELQKTFS